MAVYTRLSEAFLQAMLSVYDDEAALLHAEGIAAGSINTTYRLTTDKGVLYCRVNECRAMADLVFERDVLAALHVVGDREGVAAPTLRRTRAGGHFYLVEHRDRPVWAGVFDELPGRDLAPFEVSAAHTAQVGAFLGRAHRALSRLGGRTNPYGLDVVEGFLRRVGAVPALEEPHRRLTAALARVRRRRRLLPRGIIHGDLFVDNTKWRRDRLAAVFDWEMAGRDHLLLDVAIAICAWCWRRTEQAFDLVAARALIAGYQRERPLRKSERLGLFVELQLAAIRFTASRLLDFEVSSAAPAERVFLDWRDFAARLDAVEQLGRRGVRGLIEGREP